MSWRPGKAQTIRKQAAGRRRDDEADVGHVQSTVTREGFLADLHEVNNVGVTRALSSSAVKRTRGLSPIEHRRLPSSA